ncbi:MAG: glutamate 5-kinase [Pseudomonadota bacterium]
MSASQKSAGSAGSANAPIIVKLGSAVARDGNGLLDETHLNAIVEQIARLTAQGQPTVLVSSGAVALGLAVAPASVPTERNPVQRRQLLAAMGQTRLMAFYQNAFGEHDRQVAQVLATRDDFATRRHYLNMRGCLVSALKHGVVPVVNENDVVSVTELMFTDNDELAALLASMLGASQLIMLTNVEGVYDGPPGAPGSRLIKTWDGQSVQPKQGEDRSEFGRGGIASKVRSAQRLARLGTEVWIAHGRRPKVISDICSGSGHGTVFPADPTPATQPRRWLAAAPAGSALVVVNDGAAQALRAPDRLASLLPVGISELAGHFERGDIVTIVDTSRRPIGYGRAEYSSETAAQRLGKQRQKPLIHYDYLYIEP